VLTSLVDPLPSKALGVARALVGSAAALRALVALPTLLRLSDPAVVKVPVVDWMPEPTTTISMALFVLWFAAAVLFALGWSVPLSGAVLIGSLVFGMLLDHQNYGNHIYLMVWLVALLVVADSGAGFSITSADRPVVRWAMLLLPLQTSVVYLFSGLTKLNDSFLSGEVLAGVMGGGLIAIPSGWLTPQIMAPVAIGALAVELFLVFGLWSSRLRRIAVAAGAALHTTIALLLAPTLELIVFGVLMLAIYPLYRLAVGPDVVPEPASSRVLP
jgi:hypothetical protein